ncbi:MAG TPA: Panacea domain-containing protein [Candidatus Brocadiaceae bacterium]|nr:Panacea domain-containing protein [Candidatus Brocadiaceae bacterium]
MCIHFDFDFRKATQALNYIAVKFGGKINKMKAIKLIYFADRYHVRRYGRPITNDEYVAMDYGPVGSKTKDIAENTSFLDAIESNYSKDYIKRHGRYDIESISKADISIFSDSDIEALEFVIKNFEKFDQYQLAEISHAYPEWKKFKKDLELGNGSAFSMDYEDFFEDAVPGDKYLALLKGKDLFSNYAEDKEAMLDYMKEQHKLKSLLGAAV